MAEARALPADTLAPWAEIVPNTGYTTVDELLRRPDDGWCYEVVEAEVIPGFSHPVANIFDI